MALSKKTSISIAAGVVVLGVVAYFVWIKPPAEENVSVSGGVTSAAQGTFLTLASQLEPVSFNKTILTDPRFLALVDIQTAILPEKSGRTDPFAPLSGVAE